MICLNSDAFDKSNVRIGMRFSYPHLALSGAILVSAISAARVVGEDSRRLPGPDEVDLLNALGRIVCSSIVDGRRRFSAGTGTLVGSRSTILSSAHVFTDDRNNSGRKFRFNVVDDCVFRQLDVFGTVVVEVAFTHSEMGEFWTNSAAPNQDWAVLRTAVPLPASAIPLPFASNLNDIDDLEGLPIKMIAFHADLSDARRRPMLSEGTLFGTDYAGFRRLAHTADSGRMSSGAAIVHATENGQDIVVGVNRSSANLGEFNLAVPISIELEETLKSYAYGQVPLRRQRLAARSLQSLSAGT